MSNFYVGQRVVCIKKGAWTDSRGIPSRGPKFGERCIISELKVRGGDLWLRLVGYEKDEYGVPYFYHITRFRPLDSLTEQIERIEEEGAPVELEPEHA